MSKTEFESQIWPAMRRVADTIRPDACFHPAILSDFIEKGGVLISNDKLCEWSVFPPNYCAASAIQQILNPKPF